MFDFFLSESYVNACLLFVVQIKFYVEINVSYLVFHLIHFFLDLAFYICGSISYWCSQNKRTVLALAFQAELEFWRNTIESQINSPVR